MAMGLKYSVNEKRDVFHTLVYGYRFVKSIDPLLESVGIYFFEVLDLPAKCSAHYKVLELFLLYSCCCSKSAGMVPMLEWFLHFAALT